MTRCYYEGTIAAIEAAGIMNRAGMESAPAFRAFIILRDNVAAERYIDDVENVVFEFGREIEERYIRSCVLAARVQRKHGVRSGFYHDRKNALKNIHILQRFQKRRLLTAARREKYGVRKI